MATKITCEAVESAGSRYHHSLSSLSPGDPYSCSTRLARSPTRSPRCVATPRPKRLIPRTRSEEHTSELQSRPHLVCRLLLEKKKKHKHRFIVANIVSLSTAMVRLNHMCSYHS